MLGALSGFAIVIIVIAVGFLVGRSGVLPAGAAYAVNMFVFWVSLPAMLLDFLSQADIAALFGVNLAVIAISTLATGLIGFLGYRFLAGRGVSDSLIAMLAVSYCNSSHLGIPLMTHLVDDPTASLPVILFQVGFYGPVSVLLLDMAAHKGGSHGVVREITLSVVKSPLIVASAVGIALGLIRSSTGWALPEVIAEPISILASTTVGAALVAFGISMAEVRILQRPESPVRSVFAGSVVKAIVAPLLAFIVARFLFGATGPQLLAMVLVAALPTAQNVFTYAQRYRTGEVLARDTGVVSTVLSVPVMTGIVWLLG